MDEEEAVRSLRELEDADRAARLARLIELAEVLPDDGLIGFSGTAGEWLFEDVKTTWLYGCFVATILSAVAFCEMQLAGLIRSRPSDRELPPSLGGLEELARIAAEDTLIDSALQAQLVRLEDAASPYLQVDLHSAQLSLSRRLVEAELLGTDEHRLLEDAQLALQASTALLFRR